MTAERRIFLAYLGQRGAGPRLLLEIAAALSAVPGIRLSLCASERMEGARPITQLGDFAMLLPLFHSPVGAALELWRLPRVRQRLRQALRAARPDVAIEIMPHVWSPFLEGVYRAESVPRIAVVHDATAHPGDRTGLATGWLTASALRADRIITLSRYVANMLAAAHPSAAGRLTPLFHPDLHYPDGPADAHDPSEPLRILFLGRILPYKGCDLLVGAVERAKARGGAIALSVCGAGDLGPLTARLSLLGADVANRWLSDVEIGAALSSCDVVAAPYREASQSGVAAAAFGAGRPLIATPVGALPEQVADGVTGLVAARVDEEALADCIVRLAHDRALVETLAANVRATAEARSMRAFAAALIDAAYTPTTPAS